MKENEKFEKFVAKLKEYVDKVNKASLADGKGERILHDEVETLINELKYYLEHQDEIKKQLQDSLDAYANLYEVGIDDEDALVYEAKKIDSDYETLYLGNKVINFITGVGKDVDICYTYDGSTLTFGIWNLIDERRVTKVATIAVNTRLQFKNENELKNLVKKVGNSLMQW